MMLPQYKHPLRLGHGIDTGAAFGSGVTSWPIPCHLISRQYLTRRSRQQRAVLTLSALSKVQSHTCYFTPCYHDNRIDEPEHQVKGPGLARDQTNVHLRTTSHHLLCRVKIMEANGFLLPLFLILVILDGIAEVPDARLGDGIEQGHLCLALSQLQRHLLQKIL